MKKLLKMLLELLIVLPLTFLIIYMNVTTGHFQKDICGCTVRYGNNAVLDPGFTQTNQEGVLACSDTSCNFNLADQIKLVVAKIDFRK